MTGIAVGSCSIHGNALNLLPLVAPYSTRLNSHFLLTELSRKLGLRQKTCWLFQHKVMKAMASSGKYPLMGKVESMKR